MNKYKFEILNDIVNEASRIASFDKLRKTLLHRLNNLVDFDLGIFDLCKSSFSKLELYDPIVFSKYNIDFERKFIREYDTKYAILSYSRFLHLEGKNLILRDSDILNSSLRENSKYYKNYIRANGFDFSLNCEYAFDSINYASLTLYREIGKPDFSDEEIYFMELLTPHIIKLITTSEDYKNRIKDFNIQQKYNLTNRELELIDLIYVGMTNKEIAETLFIESTTVKKHLSNIFAKLSINNRTKLIYLLHKSEYRNIR